MNKLIEKLEKLDKDATAGNWYYHAPKVTAYGTKHDLGISGPMEDGKRKIIAETVGQVEPINKMVNSLANAILITQTRNALPEIIQALKQGEKMREVLRAVEFQCQTDGSKLIQKTLSECKEKDGHKN